MFHVSGSNVSSYINMVCDTLKNTIPKAVVYCQVREAKRSLLNYFYVQVGKKEVWFYTFDQTFAHLILNLLSFFLDVLFTVWISYLQLCCGLSHITFFTMPSVSCTWKILALNWKIINAWELGLSISVAVYL